jgi:hypothetical protein
MNKDDKPATKLPECIEGPQAFQRFDTTMNALLSVPRSTMVRREKAYRKKVEANPNRPGPKPKINASVSGHASRAKD